MKLSYVGLETNGSWFEVKLQVGVKSSAWDNKDFPTISKGFFIIRWGCYSKSLSSSVPIPPSLMLTVTAEGLDDGLTS
ncbi:putative Xaa-Pro aminopeptidase [Clarias magur]|uniref:Putative Xaa-Pro aminopeptidase n=1 Tax=Clarias magur TaxID=1594786 RepID=A0A8J4U6F9_CLAMG|nr:putative Xaa-Pro aminopeptidase [Clarias magur]